MLDVFPVAVLTGARQAGKNTLARMLAPDHAYFTLRARGGLLLYGGDRVVALGDDIVAAPWHLVI